MPEMDACALLPRFPVPDGQAEEPYLRTLVEDGLAVRLGVLKAAGCSFEPEIYRARARAELDAICRMGHARYFLIVGDFIRWAKLRDIPVGPGRGSSAGCLVAWTLGITDIDPIECELLFERFINPERVMLPDVAVDFCPRRRGEVLRYIAERYGNDRVASIAVNPGWIDVPYSRGVTIVITAKPVGQHVPSHEGRDGVVVTQLDKAAIERAGLITFDFYDLETLTVIHDAVKLVNEQRRTSGDPLLDIAAIRKDDPAVYWLLACGDITDVFQIESAGMCELLRQLRPDCMEDLAAAVALYRPGPMEVGMLDAFIAGKHGRERIEYLHPLIQPMLADTYGVLVYQEQAMQIAQAIAGYSLGRADLLRRTLGRRKKVAEERDLFVAQAIARGVAAEVAGSIFELLAEFAGYGFNRAHAAACAWLTYQTAYLKHYFPDEFAEAVGHNTQPT